MKKKYDPNHQKEDRFILNLELDADYIKTRFFQEKIDLSDVMEVFHACPVCEGEKLIPVTKLQNGQRQTLVQKSLCADCGHLFFSKMPSHKWFHMMYKKQFGMKALVPQVPPEGDYSHIYSLILPLIESKNKNDVSILDVGCGYGGALANWCRLGYTDLYGVEPGFERATVARKTGAIVHNGTVEEIFEDPKFMDKIGGMDVIYSWHAFEHIYDPKLSVTNLLKLLKTGGLLCIVVPNGAAEHIIQQAHYLPHIHSYSIESLGSLLEGCGMNIIHIDSSLRILAVKEEVSVAPITNNKGNISATKSDAVLGFYEKKINRDFVVCDKKSGINASEHKKPGYLGIVYTDYRWSNKGVLNSYAVKVYKQSKYLISAIFFAHILLRKTANFFLRIGLIAIGNRLCYLTNYLFGYLNEPYIIGRGIFKKYSIEQNPGLIVKYKDKDKVNVWMK